MTETVKKLTKNTHFRQGFFKAFCNHPEKYFGDLSKAFFRSGLELKFFKWLDSNPDVLQWNSEVQKVGYHCPVRGSDHVYIIDVYMKYKDSSGKIKESFIEVKPKAQTIKPDITKRGGKSRMKLFLLNCAKWQAAAKLAAKRGMDFKIITEEFFGTNVR